MDNALPLVSIITPSLNQGRFIEETILSVKNQTYPRVEHIIMDGGSTDGTLDILKKYSHSLIWISEPDKGQSDAINKGWRMSKGDILAYLNSDDTYMPWAVETAVKFLVEHPDVGMMYGDAEFTNESGEVTQHYRVTEFDLRRMLCSYNHVPQPSVFFSRKILESVGYLDENLHLAMDLDYWIRISLKFKIRHIAQTLATMRMHPEAKFVARYHEALSEYLHILKKFYSNPELPTEIQAFQRRAYSSVHLRASVDYLSAKKRREAAEHLIQAIRLYPKCLSDLGVVTHCVRLVLGEGITRILANLIRWFGIIRLLRLLRLKYFGSDLAG